MEDSTYYLPATNGLGGYSYRTAMLQDGMNRLRSYGYKPGFYTFLSWANNQFDTNGLVAQGNSFWLASWYSNNAELDPNTASWNGRYPSIWQYRSTGSVSGINGNVDMNYLYPANI
jgi:GH25 family lysozyme M1 (1,4-beta-N-acetylmuramidase)